MLQEGTIFNIQRFTVHDGPGIRTEIFLKGCPLKCRWCGNPESQANEIEIGIYVMKCLGAQVCGCCIDACPEPESLIIEENKVVSIRRNLCTSCGCCARTCPSDALKQWGRRITVEDTMKEIRRDMEYYRKSQGGVTVSGGEPFVQHGYVTALLKQCREEQIHTCLESTFCAEWSIIEQVLPYTDLVITDIKHMDPEIHRQHTGVSNHLILKNLVKLSKTGKPVIVRIPVIPGFNDNMENMKATADFIIDEMGNSIRHLQLLGFMRLGQEKYASLGREYHMSRVQVEPEVFHRELEQYGEYFNKRGIGCIIGNAGTENEGIKNES